MAEETNQYVQEMVELFRLTGELQGSDLHLMADALPVVRVNGTMLPQEHLRKMTGEDVEHLAFSLLSKRQREEFIEKKELDFSYGVEGTGRFRVNIMYERGSVSLVARLIPFQIPSIEELNVTPIVKDLVMMHHGLVLMTGPAGMGKSTALAAMIEYVNNTTAKHIITIEDPIEYVFKNNQSYIRQRELGGDTTSFKESLRHVLRQDPNIIMVGEMRDLDTISAAITLAETGHLILATLHTNGAAQSVDRIIDVFPPYQQDQVRFQLSMVLEGVVTLKLLPSPSIGRVPAQEIMLKNPAISNLIRSDEVSQIDRVIQTSREEGMQSMDQSIADLYARKMIDMETAQAHIKDQSLLQQ